MIIATPLDIPKIEPDNWNVFWEIWKSNVGPLIKQFRNHEKSNTTVGNSELWIGVDIYKKYNILTSWNANYVDIKNYLPLMYNQIEKSPIKNIFKVRLLQSLKDIEPHTDDDRDEWKIRSLFYCEDPEPQWYFTKQDFKINKEKYFLNMPKETNWFAYNDKFCCHGSIYNHKYKKILIQIFSPDNNSILINQSINKYKNYTINF